MPLSLSVERVFKAHLALIFALLLAYLLFQALYFGLGHDYVFGIAPLFDLADEAAIPTFVASAGLLAASAAAGLIAMHQRTSGSPLFRSWLFVALCLAFMAVDEAAALHDRISAPVQNSLGTGGSFYYGWLPVYMALAALVGVLCIPLARALPWRTSVRLIVAGAVFLGGALGVEMIEANILYEATGGRPLSESEFVLIDRDPLNIACIAIEETCELLGVALALRTMLLHLANDLAVPGIAFDAGPAGRALAKSEKRAAGFAAAAPLASGSRLGD